MKNFEKITLGNVFEYKEEFLEAVKGKCVSLYNKLVNSDKEEYMELIYDNFEFLHSGVCSFGLEYDWIDTFNGNYSVVCKDTLGNGFNNMGMACNFSPQDGKLFGVIDKTGKEVVPCKYLSIEYMEDFCKVWDGEVWNVISL